jgi:hypothetical protein
MKGLKISVPKDGNQGTEGQLPSDDVTTKPGTRRLIQELPRDLGIGGCLALVLPV